MLVRKVYAQASSVLEPPAQFTTFAELFAVIINIIIGVGIALVIVFLVIGGIQYIVSQGDPKKTDQARASLTNAIIGFVIVMVAISLRLIVGTLFGANNAGPTGEIVPLGP